MNLEDALAQVPEEDWIMVAGQNCLTDEGMKKFIAIVAEAEAFTPEETEEFRQALKQRAAAFAQDGDFIDPGTNN